MALSRIVSDIHVFNVENAVM